MSSETVATPTDRLIWRADLITQLQVSSETIRRWLRTSKLPPPDVAPTHRTQAWRLSTLRAAGFDLP